MNKNNKKQQRIRVIKTGELGTVTDQVLMKRDGRPMMYKQVKLDNSPHLDRWFWADQLGATQETCRITLSGQDASEIYINVTQDFEVNGDFTIEVTGKPSNLKEHNYRGMPLLLTTALLRGLNIHDSDIVADSNTRPVMPSRK